MRHILRIPQVYTPYPLNNMVQLFANKGNTLTPSNLRAQFGARHESTALCRWGVFHKKKSKQQLTVEELGVPVLHPKFLQGFCIRTHPCNLGKHTAGLTPFYPPKDTTRLAIVINGVQRVCQILRHSEKVLQNLILCLLLLPLALFRCVLSFWFNRVGLGLGFAFRRLKAEMLRHPCILGGPQQRGQNQKSKPTLGVTMMPLVSQSMVSLVQLDTQIGAMR